MHMLCVPWFVVDTIEIWSYTSAPCAFVCRNWTNTISARRTRFKPNFCQIYIFILLSFFGQESFIGHGFMHRQLNKKRPIVWNYLRSPKMSQVHFNTVSCFIIGFWKNHQTFFHADGILPLFQFRHRKKGLVIFSKPDHKTADKFKMEIAEKHFKGNFRRSVFSYLVVYGRNEPASPVFRVALRNYLFIIPNIFEKNFNIS